MRRATSACGPASRRNRRRRWLKSARPWWRLAARPCSAQPYGRRWNAWGGDAKKSVHAAERDPERDPECDPERIVALRRLLIAAIQQEEVTRFVFVDETSTNRTYCHRYGRAPAGRRLDQAVPLHGGPNGMRIAALTPNGLGALLSGDGAVNGAVFTAYLDQVLGPTRRPGDVVVLDNLAVHKVEGLDEIAKKYGVRLRYLPPYSPDFNPIKCAFSKLKTGLRTAKARTRDLLEDAILAAAA